MEIIFDKNFRGLKLRHSDFLGFCASVEILPKNRILTSGGRISCGIHPNLIFLSLGFPCGQNESNTSFTRPFFMIFYSCEVGPLLTEFPRNRIFDDLRICDFTGKKHNLLRKLFFRIIFLLKLCI